MTTIPRNHKRKIADIKAAMTRCRVLTLDNYFLGQDVDPAAAWEALSRYDFAKLSDNGKGGYTVHIHSNCWYELSAAPAGEDTQ